MRRLPPKSRRWRTGGPSASPEDRATAPVPLQRANLDSRANRKGSPTSDEQGGGGDGPDPGLVTQCGAVGVEELVEIVFEPADLAAGRPVLVDEGHEPGQPVGAGLGGHDGLVDGCELAEPGLDLAGRGELVADLAREFGELVLGVVQHQGAGPDQGAAVLEHGLDLGDQRVIDLEHLHGAERRFAQQRPGCRRRVNAVGFGMATRTALLGAALGWDLTGIEAGGDQRDRDVLAPARRPFDPDPFNTMGGQKIARLKVASPAVREAGGLDLDAVAVDDREREGVLMWVDPGDGGCHADDLLLEGEAPVGSGPQGCFGTSESGRTGSLQARSAPGFPPPGATALTTGTRPTNC